MQYNFRSQNHWARTFGMTTILTLVWASFLSAASPRNAAPVVPTIAIMPLEAKGIEANDADVLTDALLFRLQKSGRVRVLERAQMKRILEEQGFQSSGACDGSECAVEMGRLLSVDRIVLGSAGLVGRTYTLNLRLVRVETGEVVGSSMQSKVGSIDDVLNDLVPISANDLANAAAPGSTKDARGPGAWVWWTTGGVLLAGGAVAAAVLLREDPSPSPSQTTTSVEASW